MMMMSGDNFQEDNLPQMTNKPLEQVSNLSQVPQNQPISHAKPDLVTSRIESIREPLNFPELHRYSFKHYSDSSIQHLYVFSPTIPVEPVFKTTGGNNNFKYYYVAIILYCAAIIVHIVECCQYGTLKEKLKLHYVIDGLTITMIASDICYCCLHVQYFCGDLYNDYTFTIVPQDIVLMILYIIANYTLIAMFRTVMFRVGLSQWQTIVYKIFIVLAGMVYMGMAMMVLFSKDSLSLTITQIKEALFEGLHEASASGNWKTYSQLFQILDYVKEFNTIVQGFVTLYFFTSFGFFFQIVGGMTEFDGTKNFYCHYILSAKEQ